jgi:iron complex outermembrane recepter protein
VHLDGVYLARPAMFADFMDFERVEVLRGPQGAIYGRNSVGGTINIVTRQPTNTLETSVRLTRRQLRYAARRRRRQRPADQEQSDGHFRISPRHARRFVKDLDHPDHSLGSEDTWAGRGQLRIVFAPQSVLLLSGELWSI